MDTFIQSLQDWQFFFTSVATASATLTGLLFVSLSLNRSSWSGDRSHPILTFARNTFADFLYVLMIALVFLVPHPVAFSLTVALLVLGVASGGGLVVRELRQYNQSSKKPLDARLILRRIGLPSIASIGLIVVAIEIAVGNYDAIYGLVGVIAALLVSACWNAWLLLLQE
jgi:hypothetical protein